MAGDDVLRILPPLTISVGEIEEGLSKLNSAAEKLETLAECGA